ncbi:MAG: flagellar basal body P-ring protein FlgI [Sulfurimonas sp.]
MRILLTFILLLSSLYATKITDVSNIVGVRENQIIGYSLVVGLKKTGDGTTSKFTLQSIANMLKAMNIDMNPVDIKSKNVAAVVVTAKLKPFARQGDKFDGGMNSKGAGSESHPTTGIVFNGGLVEREINIDLFHQEYAMLSLKESGFANAVSVQNAINQHFNTQVAVALDSRSVKLKRPQNRSMIEFLAEVQNVDMAYKPKDKIVINERTGTIVAGVDIELKPIMLTHGDITIKIVEENEINAPDGSMQVDQNMVIGMNDNQLYTKAGTTTVANLVRSLQKLGATPKDIIAILEAMKSVGSISAELEVI